MTPKKQRYESKNVFFYWYSQSSMQINLNVSHGFDNLRGSFFVQTTTYVLEAIKILIAVVQGFLKIWSSHEIQFQYHYQSCLTILIKKLYRKTVDFTGPGPHNTLRKECLCWESVQFCTISKNCLSVDSTTLN